MHAFQSESKPYSCLNVKELLGQNRPNVQSLSDCNQTRTHSHLVCKCTLNHLVKLAKEHVHDMIRTCSQMHHTDLPVLLNG